MKFVNGNKRYSLANIKDTPTFIGNSILKVGILLVCLCLLSACTTPSKETAKENTTDKHLNFLYNFSTNSLDPHVDSSYVPLRAGITETLVRLDEENLTVAPWLAESWEGRMVDIGRFIFVRILHFRMVKQWMQRQ